MAFNDWLSWLICIGVVLVNGVLVYIAWWALFSDRARGRRRCPKCWYDMAYSPGHTCPECGFQARAESDFGKTRRRFGVAAMAVLSSVIIAVYISDRVSQRGYASLLPTRALMWLLPLAGDVNSSIFNELASRSFNRSGDWMDLIQHCAEGDWRARPVTDAWINKYGAFIAGYRQTFVNDPAIEKLLQNIPPRLDVTTRETWPENVPVILNVQVRDWWPSGTELRVRASPQLPEAKPIVFGRSGDDGGPRGAYSLHLPPLDSSLKEIVIDFELQRRRPGKPMLSVAADPHAPPNPLDQWQPASKQTVSVPIKITGRLEQLATPADSLAMTSAIAQTFGGGAVKWSSGQSPVRFNINPGATSGPEFDDTAVGITAELVFDGMVARRLNLWWLGGKAGLSPADINYGFEVSLEEPELLQQVTEKDNRWRLRLRGDPLLALRAGKAAKYWSGEFFVPLKLQVSDRAAPPRAWWTEEE